MAAKLGDENTIPVSETLEEIKEKHFAPTEEIFDIEVNELPDGYYRSSFFIGTLVAAGSAWAAGCGGFGMAAPILGVINADIGPDPNYVWIALGYTVPLAVGLTLVGRLSDLFGRRWFFILGSFLSLIGCIVCATAKSVPSVIGGTVLIGIAASSQLSVIFVVDELVPMKYRFITSAYIYVWVLPFNGMAAGIAYAFVVSPVGWRGCYYVMIAVNALSVTCWFLFYHPPTFHMKHQDKTKMQVLKDFDFVGLVLFTGGFLIFLFGLSWGGSVYPWKSAHVIATIVIGAITLVIFGVWETRANLVEPLIPIHLFRNGRWVAMVVLIGISCSVYYAFSVVFPQLVFALYTTDQVKGGFLCCVLSMGTNLGQISTFIAGNIGKQRIQFIGAMIIGGALLGAVACVTPYNEATVCALVGVGAFFLGYLDCVGLTMAGMVIADQKDIGAAIGMAASIRSGIASIGTAVYSVILSNRLDTTIPAVVPPAVIKAGLPASSVPAFMTAMTVGTPAAFDAVPGLNPAILAVGTAAHKVASAQAFSTVFYATIAFSGVGLILSFFAPSADSQMTNQVATTLHGRKETDVIAAKVA